MKKLIEKALVEGIRSQSDVATILSLYITEIKKEDKGEQILKDIVSEDILEVKDSIEKS